MRRPRGWRPAYAVAVFLLFCQASFGEIRYFLTEIPTFGGPTNYVKDLNDAGQVVGYADTPVQSPPGSPVYISHAFLFDGTMHDLSPTSISWSWANGINSAGRVVGSVGKPFLYDGALHDLSSQLGSALPFRTVEPLRIKDSGAILGWTQDNTVQWPFRRGFIYDGTLKQIPTFGGANSYISDMNAAGIAVGSAETGVVFSGGVPESRGYWFDGQLHEIPTFGGRSSFATGINSSGVVIGNAEDAQNTLHGYWLRDGVMHALDPFSWSGNSASAINDAGQIVGTFRNLYGPAAFIYDGTIHDLNELIDPSSNWLLLDATDINSSGQIIGSGVKVLPDGSQSERLGYLLTPLRVLHKFDLETPAAAGAVSSVRIYDGNKAEFWFSIANANRENAPDRHDGIYDSGQIYHGNSAIGLGQFTDAAGQPYLLIRLTRMGDVNLDGQVSIADFLTMASHFNSTGTWQEGDLNYDGLITIADFIALASNFGTSYSGGAVAIGEGDVAMLSNFATAHGVPEPGMMVVLLVGLAAGRQGGRRSRNIALSRRQRVN